MTKYIMLVSVLLLTACTPHQSIPLAQCDPIGIDIVHPDFYQKHKWPEIEQFYACMENNAHVQATNARFANLFLKGKSPEKMARPLVAALEYQKNLWHEVISKEKKPGAAYETWVAWAQNERAVNATNAAAAAANRAARAASDANQPRNATCIANGPFLNCNSY